MSQQDWESIARFKQSIIDDRAIAIIWDEEDVIEQAEENGIELSQEQIVNVLGLMDRKHDANIGINWDTIDAWIHYVVDHKATGETE